ncbi:MoaD/ThiS family protein [Actinobacteria bacterium YIM 96077]|uniref:MoaD/ThiS family protein n=2 Tax=Phytoactinopolyspora halophila TaxID=1981511 RepID=A0A329QQF1_9ACTN|nr:MoaD/ThiS family protein [Actinobacteria bacterium YIM 96077]RAW14141.1 MoaD/ThiS family protein [Phytoactinopolyspora halophila]
MAKVTLRYWAALRAAAGVAEETFDATTLHEALAAARAEHGEDSRFAAVLSICTAVVDETPAGSQDPVLVPVSEGSVIELLPPYAGGGG